MKALQSNPLRNTFGGFLKLDRVRRTLRSRDIFYSLGQTMRGEDHFFRHAPDFLRQTQFLGERVQQTRMIVPRLNQLEGNLGGDDPLRLVQILLDAQLRVLWGHGHTNALLRPLVNDLLRRILYIRVPVAHSHEDSKRLAELRLDGSCLRVGQLR